MFDGPFVETKELLAGYVIVSAESLDEAGRWAARYIEAVEATEVEVRELDPSRERAMASEPRGRSEPA